MTTRNNRDLVLKPGDYDYNENVEAIVLAPEVAVDSTILTVASLDLDTNEYRNVNELTYSEQGFAFTKAYETLHDGDLTKIGLQPKLCPAGVWTRGYGEAIVVNGKMLTVKDYPVMNDFIMSFSLQNEAEAEEGLRKIMVRYEKWVRNNIKVPLLQREYDALVDHTYNTGGSATLAKLINAGAPNKDIYKWFTTKYITANGKVLRGLQYRRFDNAEMYFIGEYSRDYDTSFKL